MGGCVDYLVSEGYWKKSKSGSMEIKGLGPTFSVSGREQLIRRIEEEGSEQDLRELVGVVWEEVEQACMVDRKNRYEG